MRTSKSRRPSVIRFLPVDPRPCGRIPGGTVLGKAECPSFEEPIGWIVRSPGEIPPGESPPTKSSQMWHFLPTCGIEPVLSGLADQGALQTAVRQQYRGIYDRLPFKHRRRIATGDDCEIGSMILEWCGLSDFWNDNELYHWVIRDVLPACYSAVYWSREWEGGGPGLSGDWYYVETQNPALFIREVRKITEALHAEKLAKPPPPPPAPKRRRSSKAKQKPAVEDPSASEDH